MSTLSQAALKERKNKEANENTENIENMDAAQAGVQTSSVVSIHTFGEFSIEVDGHVLNDGSSKMPQVWTLLEFLVLYRNTPASYEKLAEALWPEDEDIQLSKALKNLVYRARTFFSSNNIPFAKELILYDNKTGSYYWNNHIPCKVDFEEFEQYYDQAHGEGVSEDEKCACLLKAVELYKGAFLPNNAYASWVVPVATYYHNMFLKCIHEINNIFMEQERFAEMETLCNKALMIDQYDEPVHLALMTALVKQSKQRQALEHYSQVTDLFYRSLGVSPSKAMSDLYYELTKTTNDAQKDLMIIQQELIETVDKPGAFFCEYEVFKNIYRIEARMAARNAQSIFVVLLTVTDKEGYLPQTFRLNQYMDLLLNSIIGTLRRGDVVARYSASQYVILLPSITYENSRMVTNRILAHFQKHGKAKDAKVTGSYKPITPN